MKEKERSEKKKKNVENNETTEAIVANMAANVGYKRANTPRNNG